MKVIGLTGGIGAGKTTVSNYLIQKGFTVIDADQIARQIVEPGSAVLEKLAEAFGQEILEKDGRLNRKKLGEMVFSDLDKKKQLDLLTHGAILKRICEEIAQAKKKHGDRAVFFDAALLFETGLEQQADSVWLVDAEDEIRIQRLKKRDGFTEQEAVARISNQMDREQKRARADAILDNSKEERELYRQIDRLLTEYV